jgi:quinol monooxygenase YgiN
MVQHKGRFARRERRETIAMITIVAGFKVKAHEKEKLLEAVKELIEKSRLEPGNASYDLYEDASDPLKMTFIENWKDQAAIDSHNASEHFTRIVARIGSHLEGPMTVNFYKKSPVSL